MKSIILIGGGGHCRSVIDTIKSLNHYKVLGIIDKKERIGEEIFGSKIIDSDENLYKYCDKVECAFITIGSVGNPKLRIKLYDLIRKLNFSVPNIIDKSAIVSSDIKLGKGIFVGKGSVINSGSFIGNNCIINTGSIIEHDCIINNNVHIASGVVLCAGVSVGENSHIGSKSVIIQYKNIGSNVIIGAGSVVVRDIENYAKAYGNPCREVAKINE